MQYKLPDVSKLAYEPKKHIYSIAGKKLSGVTSVIDGTSSKQNLISWSANCAVDFLETVYKTDGAIGEVMFKDARTAWMKKRDKSADKGTDTHSLVEKLILYWIDVSQGHPVGIPVDKFKAEEHITLFPFLEWAQANVDRFLVAEQKLYSETQGYAGTCDFVAIIDGKLTIGDLKTFPKMWDPSAFIQMGAYSYAWRELTGEAPEQSVVVKMCDPDDPRIKKYGNKPFAVYKRQALAEDEEMFLTRLKMYRYNNNFVSPD